MIIMNMYHTWFMRPFTYPVHHCDLERNEPFGIIIVSVYFFAVKQPIDINKEKIKAKPVRFFFYNAIMKPMRAEVLSAFMHQFPFIIVQKFSTVHWHNYFRNMPEFILIFWQ